MKHFLGIEGYKLGRWVKKRQRKGAGNFVYGILEKLEKALLCYKIFQAMQRPHTTIEQLPEATAPFGTFSNAPGGAYWEPGYHSFFVKWR